MPRRSKAKPPAKRKQKAEQVNLPVTLTYAIADPNAPSGIYVRGTHTLPDNLPPDVREGVQRQIEQWRTDLPGTLERATGIALELARITGDGKVDALHEAAAIFNLVDELRGVDESHYRLVMAGHHLGQLMERVAVLAFEPIALGGKKAAAGRKRGPEARAAKRAERKAWVRAEYDAVLTADPKDTAKARRRVRDAFPTRFPGEKITLDTIEKYVAKPRGTRRKKTSA